MRETLKKKYKRGVGADRSEANAVCTGGAMCAKIIRRQDGTKEGKMAGTR